MTETAKHIDPCTCGQVTPDNLRVVGNQLSTYAQLRRDPTKTTTLRNQFAREMGKRFRELRGLIRKAIVDQDCFGLQNNPTTQSLPQKRQFDFPRSQDKISGFMDWLRNQEDQGILEIRPGQQVGEAVENAWTNQYVQSAYQKGVYRGRQELVQAGYQVPGIEETGGIDQAFNQPFHMDRVGLMYTRTFNELRGITDAMDQQISRVLSQGIAEGRNPNQIAQLLTRTISGPSGDLGLTDTLGRFIPAERRARVLARTEVIRAHHAATIQEYKNWGVEGVEVKAEWSTAGDARVCPQCAMREGRTYTLKEAEGMIPLHPQCRCIALPKDVTDEGAPAAREVAEDTVEEVPLEESLRTSEITDMVGLGGGINESHIVTLLQRRSGKRLQGVFKPIAGEKFGGIRKTITNENFPLAEREVLASRIDERLGFNLVPKTVIREINNEKGSLQYFVEKSEGIGFGGLDNINPEEMYKATMFDYLIGNTDRHKWNALVTEERHLRLIDHGYSFPINSEEFRFCIQDAYAYKIYGKSGLFDGWLSDISNNTRKNIRNKIEDLNIDNLVSDLNIGEKELIAFKERQQDLITAIDADEELEYVIRQNTY